MDRIQEIFEEYHAVKDQIEMPIEEMKKTLSKYEGEVCLYGAGSAGIAFLYYLRRINIEPFCFIDGNEKRWGEKCEGTEVLSPVQAFDKLGGNALVIVTINTDGKRYCKSFAEELRRGGHTGVHKMLHETGFVNVVDYTFFRRCHELFQGDPYNMPSCSDVWLMDRNVEKIQRVYEHLIDDMSREVFEKILRFRMIDDSISVPTLPQDNQYFEKGIYQPSEQDVFVDCGAFNGISARTFLRENNNQFAHYYGLEPDGVNYEELQEYVESLPQDVRIKMSIYQKAAYDSQEGAKLYELHGPGSFIADIGKTSVDTVRIDDLVQGNKVSYIKMNIEGSEIPALKGAEQTIRECEPRLAIAGYHKTWDIWEVPLVILEMNKEYRFYLRSYMNHISFVYYGVN